MGILKKQNNKDLDGYSPFQKSILNLLDEYDFEILDLRYIEEIKQIIVTMKGIVFFVSPSDISVSFEINTPPSESFNLALILAGNPKYITCTEDFTIIKDINGENVAIFGEDAKSASQNDLIREVVKSNLYLKILENSDTKFFNC